MSVVSKRGPWVGREGRCLDQLRVDIFFWAQGCVTFGSECAFTVRCENNFPFYNLHSRPHITTTTTTAAHSNMTTHHRLQSFDEDAQHLLEDGMKQITVEATANTKILYGSEKFTLYTILVMCPITHAWWIIQKRYSEFFSLRHKLLKIAKRALKTHPEVVQLLQPLGEFAFPKKYLRTDTPEIMNERRDAFKRLTSTLLAIRSSFVLHMLQAPQRQLVLNQVVDTIEAFLSVPDCQKEGELRHASITRVSESVEEKNLPACDEEMCPICLYDFADAPECTLHLGCGHVFHKDCVVPWLEQTMSCPLCRQESTHGVL
ncbi:hypothetical protein H257_01336 [Aphanomyces astaci]|uniref:RING-type domain-containing protein n=2 Tax=Aphanomyces astaci TaxID=112090 RepID=W4H8P7_APHAT|nr:hypothetical protein H257_01336 [Aphanomyces astaci]ETV87931.1 hypothetical protein H257_01336 [Aphanomyces astaci]|eukprot:XP_009822794.1 hypothetical protein H257_01336 [Aphanomyces astaci]